MTFSKLLLRASLAGFASCTFNPSPSLDPSAIPVPAERIHRSVELLIPAEFTQKVLVVREGVHTVRYHLGAVIEPLKLWMVNAFDSVCTREVESTSDIYVVLASHRPTTEADFLAIPRFLDAGERGVVVGASLEATIQIDFISADFSRSISISGTAKGTGSAIGPYAHDLAINQFGARVLQDLQQKLEERRPQF